MQQHLLAALVLLLGPCLGGQQSKLSEGSSDGYQCPYEPVAQRSIAPVTPVTPMTPVAPVVPAPNLFKWAKDHGAYIHPCLWYDEIRHGMFTTCRIPPNTNLTHIPLNLTLTKSGSKLTDLENLADKILAMTPDHILWPYVSILPKTCQIPACRSINSSEVTMLGAKRIHIEMQHKSFFKWSPEKQVAFSVVQSRTWPIGMLPITDYFNHDSHKGGKVDSNHHGSTLKSGKVAYFRGDQVFDNYGLKGQWYAYINYGYIPDDVSPTCEDLRLLRIDTHSKLRTQCIANSSSTLEAMTEEIAKAQEIGDLVMMKGAAQWIDQHIVWDAGQATSSLGAVCGVTDGSAANNVACTCGSVECTSKTGLICYSTYGGGSCRQTGFGAFGYTKPGKEEGNTNCASMSNRKPLPDKASCEAAATSMGLDDVVADETSDSELPPGCYWRRSKLYYNTKSTSTASCTSFTTAFCLCISSVDAEQATSSVDLLGLT